MGRFPTNNVNANFDKSPLTGTLETQLSKAVTLSGISNYKVYYSNNGNATEDVNDINNYIDILLPKKNNTYDNTGLNCEFNKIIECLM